MTLQNWKLKQIDLANQRLAHYHEIVLSMQEEGRPPSDPAFDDIARLGWLETFRIEIMFFDDRRYYHSSDGDLIMN